MAYLKLNDNCLIRYLIARSFNLAEAKEMLLRGIVRLFKIFRSGEKPTKLTHEKCPTFRNICEKIYTSYLA